MKWRIPIAVLTLLLLGGFGITVLNIGRTNIDAVTVTLGIELGVDHNSQFIDEQVLTAIQKNTLDPELRLRLQRPQRTVRVETFHIDQCEVSQESYERFLNWIKPRFYPEYEDIPDELKSLSTGNRSAGRLNSPASGVTQAGAARYCQAVGGRLPYSEELEIAARGREARLYPWGNEFTAVAWPYIEADRNAQQRCGSHPDTSTPSEIHDLANNVMEWTEGSLSPGLLSSDEFVPVHGAPPIRTRSRELYSLSAAWLDIHPTVQSHHLGFRCAYDTPPFPILPWNLIAGDTISILEGDYEIGIPPEARVTSFMTKIPRNVDIALKKLVLSTKEFTQGLRVDRCEVSRSDYADFLRDPLVKVGLYRNTNEPSGHSYTPLNWKEQLQDPGLPVTGVTWWSADAFARWSGGRLPTVEEWRALAAGPEGLLYPWGNEYDPAVASTGDDKGGRLVGCDSDAADVNSNGISNLGANVSEWTRSVSIDRGAISMWVQGGNWMLPGLETARSYFGRKVTVSHRTDTIGFRVVYD